MKYHTLIKNYNTFYSFGILSVLQTDDYIETDINQVFCQLENLLILNFIKYFNYLYQKRITNKKMLLQKTKSRKLSFYDGNGFKTDQFSMQILQYLTDHQEVQNQVIRWKEIIPEIKHLKENNERTLIYRVREGIPDSLRKQIWPKLIMKPVKSYSFYVGKSLCKQIDLDLDRTFPENKIVKQLTTKMKNILNAIAAALPQLGYCQGMNFISAIILLKLQQEQAFNMMYHIFHWQKHQDLLKNLDEIHRKMFILDKLIKKNYPKLHRTLNQFNIDCLFYASPWFITLFCNTLPCSYVLRILEMYLLQGQKILYRVALQILKIKKNKIKKLQQFQEIVQELKNFQDLITSDQEINNFIYQMFEINLSRKELQNYNKQFQLKRIKNSPVKQKK